jgi:hypothetical protein
MPDKTHKINKDYIQSVVNQELSLSTSWMHSDLSQEQADNLDYYYGEPFGNEEEGFSQIVTRDVMETVEGILPDLMKIFAGNDEVVKFDATSQDDEERVEVEGGYINHVFMNRSGGYKVLYDWFKDALLMKNGMVKVGWSNTEDVQFRNYDGLTKEEYEILKDGQALEGSEVGTTYEVESHRKIDNAYDVRVKITKDIGKLDFDVLPSEEFIIKERSTSIKDCSFCAHVMEKTVGELIEMGYDEDEVSMATTIIDADSGPVANSRYKNPDETTVTQESARNEYDRLVEFAESYIRVFDPDDDTVKLYRAFTVGKTCMEYEEVDRIPIIALSPIMMPHKFTGVAVADLVRDIQEIRSTIFRQMLDNLALQNAGRYTAVEGQVNYQDLIDNRIGGIIRQKVAGAVGQLPTPDLSQFTIPVLNQLDIQKENRTGVSRMTQGLDDNALNSHQTSGAVTQMMTAAQGKILLIARNFAETGVSELFYEMYQQIRENQTKPDIFPYKGRYALVTPLEWIDRYDTHVTVGIGNGNKDQQLIHLQNISQLLQQIGNTQFGYLIQADNVYNLATEFIKNSGYSDPQRFISNPETVQPPPPPPDPDLIKAQTDQAFKDGTLDLDRQKFGWERKVNAGELALEAGQERPVGVGTGK